MASNRDSGGSVLEGILVATAAPRSDHFDTIWGHAFRFCDRVWSAGRLVLHPPACFRDDRSPAHRRFNFWGLPLKCSFLVPIALQQSASCSSKMRPVIGFPIVKTAPLSVGAENDLAGAMVAQTDRAFLAIAQGN